MNEAIAFVPVLATKKDATDSNKHILKLRMEYLLDRRACGKNEWRGELIEVRLPVLYFVTCSDALLRNRRKYTENRLKPGELVAGHTGEYSAVAVCLEGDVIDLEIQLGKELSEREGEKILTVSIGGVSEESAMLEDESEEQF